MIGSEDGVGLDSTYICGLNVERSGVLIEEDGADVYVLHGEFARVFLVLDVGLHGWVRARYW